MRKSSFCVYTAPDCRFKTDLKIVTLSFYITKLLTYMLMRVRVRVRVLGSNGDRLLWAADKMATNCQPR